MQRIQTENNRFISGNPTLGTPGTIVTAKFLNDIQEEISNVIINAGLELDGENESQLSESIEKLIEKKSMLVFNNIPTSYVVDVIYVKGIGYLEWRQFGSWSGYATLNIGQYIPDTDPDVRTMTIDAVGDTYLKAELPGLWAWAQAKGKVVSAANWKSKIYSFVDLGTSFRVPDMRDVFIRATGTDADNANARALGSYQQDAIKDHGHGLYLYTGSSPETKGNSIAIRYAPAAISGDGGIIKTYGGGSGGANESSSSVATQSYSSSPKTETRGENVALAPRIIAY